MHLNFLYCLYCTALLSSRLRPRPCKTGLHFPASLFLRRAAVTVKTGLPLQGQTGCASRVLVLLPPLWRLVRSEPPAAESVGSQLDTLGGKKGKEMRWLFIRHDREADASRPRARRHRIWDWTQEYCWCSQAAAAQSISLLEVINDAANEDPWVAGWDAEMGYAWILCASVCVSLKLVMGGLYHTLYITDCLFWVSA